MTDENNQIKFFLYENWARTKTGQHTVYFIASYNFVEVMGVSSTWIGFLILLSKDDKVPIYYSPVA